MSKIIGVTVGTTKPRANFGQTNPKKADYIKNRPTAKTEAMTQPVGVDENGDLWTVPGGVGGITEETDPTVPEWAKQPNKPTYTADEVKARPNTWMPTAEDVGARPSTWTPTASDVGADASGTAASKVTEHNAATDAHNDIRLLIQGLDARLTALADSDDTTLDQLSELVSYIKDNRELIESITTDKVNVSDIINNLTTNDAKKPLSAAQGVALKALIDALTTTVNGKVTEAQVATAISNALKAYPTTTAMQTAISTALADYAKADHNHDGVYAAKSHDHNGVYQPAGSYAAADHNHDGTYAKPSDIPTKLSQLTGDSTHRTVTDAEKTGWNGKAAGGHDHDGVYVKQTELNDAVNTALQTAKDSGDFNGEDGKSPTATVSKVGSAAIIEVVNADGTTSTAHVQDGIIYAEVLYVDTPADLEGVEIDKTKVYVCKENYKQYAFKQVKTVIESGDLVPTSTPSSTQLTYGWVDGEGYCANRRLSSDGTDQSHTNARTTGYIEVNDDDFLTIKNYLCANGVKTYFNAYDESKTLLLSYPSTGINGTGGAYIPSSYDFVTVAEDGTATFKKSLSETFGVTGIKYLRISWGNTTVIEVYGKRVTTVTEWTAIRDFVPTDRSKDIDKLQEDVNSHNVRLTLLEQGKGGSSSYADAINKIRNYDKPIYDTLAPYLLEDDIEFDASKVMGYTDAQDPDRSKRKALVQRVYDDYNELCTNHPEYVRDVTETFGGLCSDNTVDVRVYEFCERAGRVQTDDATRWSERKPTIIIVSGIHQEWNGVYSMLEALRCIVTDGALRWIRRNFRIVILPVCNPYSFYGANASGHYNANGIEIHNNFVVDFSNASDATHGTEPLTEVETNYINNVMQTYRDDAVCLLSCHSNATKGANFIWGSVATKMMVNTVLRLVDMMSYAWDKKYPNYRNAIDTLKSQGSNPQDAGDYRCGFANMSTSFGTEAKQALYHGFQGLNVEVYERFYLFDPDGADAALAVSRGAEAYVNLLRLLAATYDHNDRDKYAPTPAYEFVE